LECFFLGTKYVSVNAPRGADRKWAGGARQLRISRQGRLGMSGHLNLRNDSDEARLCISNEIPDLVLGVKAAVRNTIADVRIEVLRLDRLLALRSNLSQLWILFDFDPPALIIGEMQLKV